MIWLCAEELKYSNTEKHKFAGEMTLLVKSVLFISIFTDFYVANFWKNVKDYDMICNYEISNGNYCVLQLSAQFWIASNQNFIVLSVA